MAGTLVGLYVRSFAKIILVLQRLTDYAMESAAGVKRICLGDVGESKQQALPARMRCRSARQGFHGKPAGLCKLRQLDVADAGAEPRDQMHPTGLEIHGDPIAEHRFKAARQRPAACRIKGTHAFEMAREVTLGHESGNHALLERRMPQMSHTIGAREGGNQRFR